MVKPKLPRACPWPGAKASANSNLGKRGCFQLAFGNGELAWLFRKLAVLKHGARVQQAVGINRLFDRPHQVEGDRVLDAGQQIALEPANAMFGGN